MLTKLGVLVMILTIAGCANSTVLSDCLIFKEINGDPARVPADVQEQIDDHNKVGVDVCGW